MCWGPALDDGGRKHGPSSEGGGGRQKHGHIRPHRVRMWAKLRSGPPKTKTSSPNATNTTNSTDDRPHKSSAGPIPDTFSGDLPPLRISGHVFATAQSPPSLPPDPPPTTAPHHGARSRPTALHTAGTHPHTRAHSVSRRARAPTAPRRAERGHRGGGGRPNGLGVVGVLEDVPASGLEEGGARARAHAGEL